MPGTGAGSRHPRRPEPGGSAGLVPPGLRPARRPPHSDDRPRPSPGAVCGPPPLTGTELATAFGAPAPRAPPPPAEGHRRHRGRHRPGRHHAGRRDTGRARAAAGPPPRPRRADPAWVAGLAAALGDIEWAACTRARSYHRSRTGAAGCADAVALRERRPTTNRPMWRETETSTVGGEASRLADRGQVLRREADTGVVDLDQHAAVGQRVTGDLDLGSAGRRTRLAFSRSSATHGARGRTTRPATSVVGKEGQLDALAACLHLGGGGAEHVDQRDRPASSGGSGPLTGEDQEVSHRYGACGSRVWLSLNSEDSWSAVGPAGPVVPRSATAGAGSDPGSGARGGEHRADAAPQQGLLRARRDRPAVHVAEGRAATRLISSWECTPTDSTEGADVLRVGLGELGLTTLGQAVLGDLGRCPPGGAATGIMERATT